MQWQAVPVYTWRLTKGLTAKEAQISDGERNHADVHFVEYPDARRTLLDHPDRLELVNMEISNLGCKVIAQYAVLGPYDFVTTIEAPDNATIARLSVSLGARGTINIMTLPAIPTPELGDKLKEGAHLGP